MAAFTKFTMDDIYAITGGLNINPGIANGASFRVYLGTIKRGNQWNLPKQTVVVKAPVDNNQRSIQAFERELAALTSIQHKYIVKLIGYRNEGDQRYLVVEYLDNGTLLDKIDESLTWHHVRRMLKGVARGIEHIHGMNLVHTDICPANILIDKRYKAKLNGLGFVVWENQHAVAEYRDGFRLEQTHEGGLTWHHVRRMLKGVARGIEHIHGMNLVHTDICPANILIDKRYKAKLNGLGFVVWENQHAVAEYRDGFRPEQTHEGARARKSDDLYSLGVAILMLMKKTTSPTVTIDGVERSLRASPIVIGIFLDVLDFA